MTAFKEAHHAVLFAFLTREARERFGASGDDAILEGTKRYGRARGGRMAALAARDGYAPDFISYVCYGELPMEDHEIKIVQKAPHVVIHNTRCGWHRTWVDEGLLEYGHLYCQVIDTAILQGFNPEFRFEVDGVLTDGRSPHCTFRFKDGRLGPIEGLRYVWRRKRLARLHGTVKKPMAFHVADLYLALADVLAERFGAPGREAATTALALFGEKYGPKAEDVVKQEAARIRPEA